MPGRTPPKRRPPRIVLIALAATLAAPGMHLLLAASGDGFVDTVDVEVGARDTVLGTLRPAEERESFPIVLPRGAKIKATAKGTGSTAPAPLVEIADPDGLVVASGAAAKTAKTPQIVAERSGVHRVRVCGDGVLDGDYRLTVRAKMPKAASESSTADLAPGAEATFTFGAAAGASATLTLAAARRSSLLPTIAEVTGPGGFALAVAAPTDPGKRHVLRKIELPESGDYTVRFRNDAALAGGWTAKARLRGDRAPKATIEITDDVLAGEFAGEQAVYARTVGPDGGVVAPDGGDLDLVGVSVEVPAGAVSEPTLFTIAEADPFFVDDDLSEGGTTFELGPSGVAFGEDVTVTVPFDAQAYDDPGSEVQVAIRDRETGAVEIVPGTVDVIAGTVTFQTPHFSGFQAVSPRPRPLRGGYVELEIAGGLDPGFGGSFTLGLNGVVGQPGARTGNVVARGRDRYSIGFGTDGLGGVVLTGGRDQSSDVGTVAADQDLTLLFGSESVAYLRGRSPDVLVREETQGGRAGIAALLRRVKGRPTQGALRGDWHGVVLEVSAARGTSGGLVLVTAGQRFRLGVDPEGRAVASDSDRWTTRVAYPTGQSVTQRIRKRPKPGTLSPSGAFARLTLTLGEAAGAPFVDLHPVVRGDVLVGVTGALEGDPQDATSVMTRLVILARAGGQGGDDALSGRSQLVALDAGFEQVVGVPVPVPTLELLDLDVVHDGRGGLRARGVRSLVRHALTGQPGVGTAPVDVVGTYRIDKDLVYRESAPLGAGAVLRRRGLYVTTLFGADRIALGLGLPSRPAVE